ncbi:MAG: AAA family ATPase [Candidatus Methanofastidiosia archaeon]|jgi:predicted ATPase
MQEKSEIQEKSNGMQKRTYKSERVALTTLSMPEKEKIDLSIKIKNFGPIISSNIIFKPLTLFIGPNNAGKSYTAMLVHSLFESLTPDVPLSMIENFSNYFNIQIFETEFPEFRDKINNMKEGEKSEIPLDEIINRIFEKIYNKRLNNEIIRSYACALDKLVKFGEKSFRLEINNSPYEIDIAYQEDNPEIKWDSHLGIRMKVEKLGQHDLSIEVIKDNEIFIEIKKWSEGGENREYLFMQLINWILKYFLGSVFRTMATLCYYLPAARSGILQGHKALAATIVKKAPLIGIEKLEIPKFSGIVSDLISSIISLPEKEGPFFNLAQELEQELIKGDISVKTEDEYVYPEIQYNFKGTEIPLHRTSSTVSELAPLILYLKYKIEPGNILVIEEPEAHLHPENQRILAKFLVKLIRKGAYIIITTHSDYLIEQLSSFILLSKVEPKKRKSKYKYNEEDYLNADEVGAYVFNYDKANDGYKTAEIKITEEEGISQEEHMRIIEALYEETLKLRRDIG